MKHLLVIVLGLSTVLAACSPQIVAAMPTEAPSMTSTPADGAPAQATPTAHPSVPAGPSGPVQGSALLTPAEQAAVASLSQTLGLPADQIKVVSSEAVTWPNGCMGVQRIGVMCTMNIVPGYRIVLEARGKQYEVHTNLDGSIVVPADNAMLAPGPADTAAIHQLATNLGIADSDVKLVSSVAVQWPDSCLGVALFQVMCSQIVTPGYLIVLEGGGRQYEYHTNQDASQIMPATLAMDWRQQGGIAGLCQSITVYLSGEVYGMNCAPGSGDGRMEVLDAGQRQQLYGWIDGLANATIDLSDPQGVSDRMTRTADLMGHGTQPAADPQQHAIFAFGQALFQQLYH